MEKHFTATVYIFDRDKTLLIFHKKLRRWMPPGGHVDPNETPPEAAKREAFEETGLEIELISQETLWVNYPHSKSIERPYHCFLQEMPAYGNTPAHYHMDFVYMGRPIGGRTSFNERESEALRWFTWQEVQSLREDTEIFPEVKQVLEGFFTASNNEVRV